ncbi:hypothetical protein [Vreelandella profundi]|uniref:hypothetical protein n=1 Tax=Vreelandella profundi TaxID=2852117 RepID=UPI001F33B5D9|nr:hypothetical protein [Halomonas profundi]
MTQQPTHTHRESGGKYQEIAQHQGSGAYLEGRWLVLYRDLDKGIDSITNLDEWESQWKEVAPDDCPICVGAGHDQLKGNRDKPCGGCYGLGKVRKDGQTPADMWELSDVAYRIIQLQQNELEDLRKVAAHPGVMDLIKRERQDAIDESTARQEQEWRRGKGHGPHGQRHTGD